MSAEFIDTNILVYAHDHSAGVKRAAAAALLQRLFEQRRGVLSSQVLMEFYSVATGKLKAPIPARVAMDVVRDFAAWPVYRPGAEDVLEGATLAQKHRISFWDAMIICAASRLGATVIWSEDLADRQVYAGVEVRNPFAT
jgi:predicted nucleic acid-binding protein